MASLATMQQLREWACSTVDQSFEGARNRDALRQVADESRFFNYLASLRQNDDFRLLLLSPVTGSLSQGWKDLNTTGPLFQQSLVDVATRWPCTWTPAEYLLEYAVACKTQFPGQQAYDLGRALRNLPSLMREYLICDALACSGVTCSIPSVTENAEGHTDIHVETAAGPVAVWSFQATSKGFTKLGEKIRYRAADFPARNVLAAFDMLSDGRDECGWLVPSDDYISALKAELVTPRPLSADEVQRWLRAGSRSDLRFVSATADTLHKV